MDTKLDLYQIAKTVLVRLELAESESNNDQFICAALLPDLRQAVANFEVTFVKKEKQ